MFCFTVDALCSGLFEIWRFSVQMIYSGFKVIEAGIFFMEISDYFLEIVWSSCRPLLSLFTNLTSLCHICWMVCSLTVTYDWCPVIWRESWLVRLETLTLSGTPDYTPFGEFMIHQFIIYCIHYILLNLSVYDYVFGFMTFVCLPGLVWLHCLGLRVYLFVAWQTNSWLNWADEEHDELGLNESQKTIHVHTQ